MSDRQNLPAPATQTDDYLFDVAISLRQMITHLAQMVGMLEQMVGMLAQMTVEIASTPADEIALREPETKKRRHRQDIG